MVKPVFLYGGGLVQEAFAGTDRRLKYNLSRRK